MRSIRLAACAAIIILIAFFAVNFKPEKEQNFFSESEAEFTSEDVRLPDIPAEYCLERPQIDCRTALPLEKGKVSSLFGMRKNPVSGQYKFHSGYDIAASQGTKIKCAADGIVKKAGFDSGYGNFVVISHIDGIETLYAHMNQINVTENENVKMGYVIGTVGKTGAATGSHLHFELIIDGKKYDPEWILCGAYD